MSTGDWVLMLPQRAWLSQEKVVKLAQVLRSFRYGARPASLGWHQLEQSDRDYWIDLATRHLVASGIAVPVPRRGRTTSLMPVVMSVAS